MTGGLLIRLEQYGQALELEPGWSNAVVGEGPVLLTFPAPTRPRVELDDQQLVTSWRSTEQVAACNFDLTNQVGYHRLRLHVGACSYDFDFHTSTTKATRDEVLLMAEVCGQHYLGYRRQFSYVAANGDRRTVLLPQIHFAWLRERVSEIAELAQSINARPAMTSVPKMRSSTRAKGMSLSRTIRLLHEQPHLLDQRDDGPIVINEKRYWPAKVVEKVRDAEPAMREHSAIAYFVNQLLCGCRDLQRQVHKDVTKEIEGFAAMLSSVAALPIFVRAMRAGMGVMPVIATPTAIERADSRYARLRTLRSEYLSDIGPSEDYERSIRANVKDIWEIYQTFVGHVIGNALGLHYYSAKCDLRDRDFDGASMRSTRWALGFDAKPPGKVLTSWRDKSNRPGGERPDIALVASTAEESLLLDAKFRTAANSARATQEDLFEMQGYLNSFDVSKGGIVYPGNEAAATLIEAGNNRLVELPIRADFFQRLGGKAPLHDYVFKAIDLALQPLKS